LQFFLRRPPIVPSLSTCLSGLCYF
jgi:hypothetical protein